MNRKALEDMFLAPGVSPWKTFLLEVHADGEPEEFLRDAFGNAAIRETEDRFLHSVVTPELEFTVDHLDSRFWSFHSNGSAAQMNAYLKAAVARRRDLDFVWLPSAHLRQIRRGTPPNWIKTEFRGQMALPLDEVQELAVTVRGRPAQDLLDVISGNSDFPYAISVSQLELAIADPDLGVVREAVNRFALFVAKGDSFALHQNVVQSVATRYRRLVEAAEHVALGIDAMDHADRDEGGGRLVGGPIELTFSRPLLELDRFVDNLLSSREPFRLWGIVGHPSGDYREVEAVDLHVGQRLRLEVSSEMVRIHLRRGGCGNTVARLVSNLQHHVDGGLTASDPEIQSQLAMQPIAA